MNKKVLEERVAELIGSSLGLDVFPRRDWFRWRSVLSLEIGAKPYVAGLRVMAQYLAVFWLLPWLFLHPDNTRFIKENFSLYALQVYGGLWAGWATISTGLAARSLWQTIRMDIIPYMPEESALAISRELGRKFERRRFLALSWGIGFASAALAGALIDRDLSGQVGLGEILLWSAGWAILFATSAGVVNVARFYAAFANHLEDDPQQLFKIDPARSSLLTNIASLGQRTLLFWFGIAVSIALIIPFSVKDWSQLPDDLSLLIHIKISENMFLSYDVVATSFFSIGIGTVVFLKSEAALRRAARISSAKTLRLIEGEAALLVEQLGQLDEAGWKRLSELRNWHSQLALAGSYKSALLSGMSLLLPLIAPLLSFLAKIWSHSPPP